MTIKSIFGLAATGFLLCACQSNTFQIDGFARSFEEGDTICIDIPNASIRLDVSDEVLAARKAAYVAPAPNITSGWLARYAKLVDGANHGAVML